MIKGRKVLGLITARGGSKGVPGKNIRVVNGDPLIAWTINAGKASKYLDRLILSSDDNEIIEAAKVFGCDAPFKRESKLAKDETPSIDVVLDALNRCPGYDWVVLLQPTSPLRLAEDIDGALEQCMQLGAPACVSVCESEQNPYWMYLLDADSRMKPVVGDSSKTRRQDIPKTYVLNGSVYVAKTSWLTEHKTFITPQTVAYEMPLDRSLDIDTEADIEYFSTLVEQRKH